MFGSSFVARFELSRVFTVFRFQARPFILGLFATSLCAAGVDDDVAIKNELKRHQGTWIATSSTFDGQKAPDEIARSIQRIVAENHVVWERQGKRFAGTTIELDPIPDPKNIDVIPDGGRNRGERVLGIYKLDGVRLTICMARAGQPRPREFKAEKGSGWTLQTFERVPTPAK
jgi:uncharacterized protein (TIGR03067 family)